MAVEGVMLRTGFVAAGENLSNTAGLAGPSGSGQFLAMKYSTAADLTILRQGSANGRIAGILQNKPAIGEPADICFEGVSKVVFGGTVTRGDYLTTDTSGRLVTATTGQLACGQAMVSGVVSDVGTAQIFGDKTIIAP